MKSIVYAVLEIEGLPKDLTCKLKQRTQQQRQRDERKYGPYSLICFADESKIHTELRLATHQLKYRHQALLRTSY